MRSTFFNWIIIALLNAKLKCQIILWICKKCNLSITIFPLSPFQDKVHNCDVTNEESVPKPLLDTQEPICPQDQTACADGTCIETALFCDGHPDCPNWTDEMGCHYCDQEIQETGQSHYYCRVSGQCIPSTRYRLLTQFFFCILLVKNH